MNRLAAAAIVLIALPACDRYDPDGVFVRGDCEQQRVEEKRPEDATDDAYVGGWVFAQLICEAPEATLGLTRQGGQVVDGEVSVHLDRHQLRLRPDEFLVPNSTYTARVETDDGNKDWTFATSATGTAVGDALTGIAAAGDAGAGLLLEPAGYGPTLKEELQAMRPALELLTDGPSPTARLGAWTSSIESGTQDGSRVTADLALVWDDPHFSTVAKDLRWRLENVTLVLEDAVVGGGVEPGPGSLDGFWMEGKWDTREAQAALGDVCGADLDADGPGCAACRDGEEACLPFLLVHVPQAPWTGDLVEVE